MACLAAALLSPGVIAAQDMPAHTLIGQVTGPDRAPLDDATVRVTRGAITRITRTDANGRYRVTGLSDGAWTLSVQRIGHVPFVTTVELTLEGVRRDVTLDPRPSILDSVLVSARWTGVRGLTYDARRMEPLPAATVRIVGLAAVDTTNADGQFAIEVQSGRAVLLRIEREGFLPVMRSATVPGGGYIELDIPLDTANPAPRDFIETKDLELRLRSATGRAVVVGRDELVKRGARSLQDALVEAPSVIRRGVTIDRKACVFVNGRARPGFPVDALRVEDIEFVEAYPPNSDWSKTLINRWPPRAECGAPGGTSRGSGGDPRSRAQFVSVWLRDG